MGGVILCDNNQAAGFFVEAMDNARSEFASHAREHPKAVQQGIDQGSAVSFVVGGSRAGVDHHSRRFVHDGKVVIFVNYVERDFFRNGAQWRPIDFAHNLALLAPPQLKGCPSRFPIDQDLFLRNQLLDSRTAGIGDLGYEEVIEATPRVF